METNIAQTTVYIIALMVIGGGIFAYLRLRKGMNTTVIKVKQWATKTYDEAPIDLKKEIDEAIKFGADFAEAIDLNGKIAEFQHELQTKGEAKLMVAVDTAAEWIELYVAGRGYTVDVPETLIKRLIEAYVFNNKDTYPSKGK